MKNKILIFGAGFVGKKIQSYFNCPISTKRIDGYSDVQEEIVKYSPDIIINCIGNLGKNVDQCEKDVDKSLFSNSYVPLILAEAAIRNGLKFIHISTGCIYHYDYDNQPPIDENKEPDFFDLFYSRTKIYSDRAISLLANRYPLLVVRFRVPLDDQPDEKNLLTKLIKYKKVIDLPNSVTYMPEFNLALEHLIEKDAKGIFNIVNPGALKYQDLVDIYKKFVPDFEYRVVKFKELNIVRTNLILSAEKLIKSGFKIRNIYEVLEECVKNYLKF